MCPAQTQAFEDIGVSVVLHAVRYIGLVLHQEPAASDPQPLG
jgi:hypothetical protein